MANTYFQFKQFRVEQEQTAMKVCTDACLFGAWVAREEQQNQRQRILDIGTGTGLLSLMVAQQVGGAITAIDLDAGAVQQAASNFQQSPWKERLHVEQADFNRWSIQSFDLIISNPPFFDGDLLSANTREQQSKHTVSLSFDALLKGINVRITDTGSAYLLMAARHHDALCRLIREHGFHIHQLAWVKQTPRHEPFRIMFQFSKKVPEMRIEDTLVIRDYDQAYTPEFRSLLTDYYLAF